MKTATIARIGGGSSYSGGSHSSSGGGHSYSGSSHSSGGSSYRGGGSSYGGGSCDGVSFGQFVMAILVVIAFVYIKQKMAGALSRALKQVPNPDHAFDETPARLGKHSPASQMQKSDPTFSETLFLDFAGLLYARFHEARGSGDISMLAAYFSPELQARFGKVWVDREKRALKDITGVVIGACRIQAYKPWQEMEQLDVSFKANYTAVFGQGSNDTQAYYVDETWSFQRKKGVVSRTPENVERLGCPSCGSAIENRNLGQCGSCGNPVTPGQGDWYVATTRIGSLETRGPLLVGNVPEVGTEWPTVISPALQTELQRLLQRHPDFSLDKFKAKVRSVFMALQEGWSNLDLKQLRPHETDNIFQQHRFWIEEYRRQGLCNKMTNIVVQAIEYAKITTDAYYDVVTVRIHASMKDYTIRLSDHKPVAGSMNQTRPFTEYWTFVRSVAAKDTTSDATQCPSCGAQLNINQAGLCDYCRAKITRGQFDWVLSRIDQDEEYLG